MPIFQQLPKQAEMHDPYAILFNWMKPGETFLLERPSQKKGTEYVVGKIAPKAKDGKDEVRYYAMVQDYSTGEIRQDKAPRVLKSATADMGILDTHEVQKLEPGKTLLTITAKDGKTVIGIFDGAFSARGPAGMEKNCLEISIGHKKQELDMGSISRIKVFTPKTETEFLK